MAGVVQPCVGCAGPLESCGRLSLVRTGVDVLDRRLLQWADVRVVVVVDACPCPPSISTNPPLGRLSTRSGDGHQVGRPHTASVPVASVWLTDARRGVLRCVRRFLSRRVLVQVDDGPLRLLRLVVGDKDDVATVDGITRYSDLVVRVLRSCSWRVSFDHASATLGPFLESAGPCPVCWTGVDVSD